MDQLINRLQFKDFRLILAIKQSGQLAIAAEQLSMTQPAASRMLAAIERTVEGRVFERHPKGMRPTAIGEILAQNAVSLLRGLEGTVREVRSVSAGLAGAARVGSVTGGAVGFIVPAIQDLKKIAKGADIHIDVAPSDILVDGLIAGEFDFVLSRIPAGVDARRFHIQRGRVEEIRFLVRREHPLAGKRTLALKDLEGFEWVIQPPLTPMRKAVEEAFTGSGIVLPDEIVNTTSLLVMIAYLEATNAVAPVTREVADILARQGSGQGFAALEIADPIIINPYHAISLRSRTLSPLATRLLELVVEKLKAG